MGGKQQITPFSLQTKSSDYIQMSVLPANPEKYAGYTLTFSVEEDRLKSLSGGARGISWGAGYAEIILEPPESVKKLMPEIIIQKKSDGNQITVYNDGSNKIMCEGKAFFVRELPRDIENLSLRTRTHSSGIICLVEGKVSNKNYLLALSLNTNSNEWEIMHEILAESIESTQSGIYSTDLLPTMLRHEKRCFFKPFCSSPEKVSFTPTVFHEYKSELIPYLFLESLAVKNEDATSYLDNSLEISFQDAIEFFGEFDEICSPPLGAYDVDVIAVYDSKKRISRPDIYKFEINNAKITNIVHLLTCY